MVQVAAYSNRFEADTAVARLNSAGIPATISADDLAGAFPLMSLWQGGCRVLVAAEHEVAARRELTRVGSHAVDTRSTGHRQPVARDEQTRRVLYVLAAIVAWWLGAGWIRIVFGG